MSRLTLILGSVSLVTISYLYYVKQCYKYLKLIGYDGPVPQYFIGNLAEFASKENSVSGEASKKTVINHYSKTLQRWTKQYGKIYGYYEGHSPVLVLADPDLVSEVFLDQNKLLSYRRSFPMSKSSDDPNADIFVSNGMRWMRVRYGLEKVMLNNRNIIRCLEYADKSFIRTFSNQNDLNKPHDNFNIHNRIKLFMVQTMFNIIFGIDLESFIAASPLENAPTTSPNSLYHSQIVAHKFGKAFAEYEGFSLLKFTAITVSELSFLWQACDRFKKYFNTNIFLLACFADPMDWFFENFIKKHLLIYSEKNTEDEKFKPTDLKQQNRGFSLLNSFLFLTYNSIFKDLSNEMTSNRRISSYQYRKRAFTVTDYHSIRESQTQPKLRNFSFRGNETAYQSEKLAAQYKKQPIKSYLSVSNLKEDLKEYETEEFEAWKLTINEALTNSLLMLFAGYETTSSAIGFCCHVLTQLPDERDKLIDEIKDFRKHLGHNLNKFDAFKDLSRQQYPKNTSDTSEDETSFDDDVFEDTDKETNQKYDQNSQKNSDFNFEQWNDLYSTLDKMKYLDMFIKEVLRMFPIANSMVSRKCMVEDLYLDNGNYYIPKGINIVVDVLSIHYNPVLWGPVDPNIFYPERFLTDRNPAAYLPFGIGARKCLGAKLAMSQIKLFIVRLLQNYTINATMKKRSKDDSTARNDLKENELLNKTIETKEVFFNGPLNNINVEISNKYSDSKQKKALFE